MTLRFLLPLLSALLLADPAGAAAPGDTSLQIEQRHWKLVSERDGIQVYMAHNDDSRIKTFRGVTVMEYEDFYSPIAILDDEEYLPRWLYLIREVHELRRRSPVDRDYQMVTKLPWPVADRDAGLHFRIQQDPQTAAIRIDFRSRDGILPPNPDYVRIPEMVGHFSSVPIGDRKVQVSFEVLLDPGGYIPAFMANFILKDIPYQSLQRFRRIVNEDRFRGYYVDYLNIPEPWASLPPIPRSPILPSRRQVQ
ncbi:MAG: hypothetical protein ACOY33_09550 [Pseudomonadota bacterium]